MGWKDFVTKPWTGSRGQKDNARKEMARKGKLNIDEVVCLSKYKFHEVVPCSPMDSTKINGEANYMYELNHDGSGLAYESISKLRSAKIRNFMQVPNYHGVKAFFPQRSYWQCMVLLIC